MIDRIGFDNGVQRILPLDFRETLSTAKMFSMMECKINELVNLINSWENGEHEYTNEKVKELTAVDDELKKMIESGDYIKDGSINASKMDMSFVNDLQNYIIRYLGQCVQLVSFGINDDGYFTAYIPRTWKDIQFFTNDAGQLCLKILQPSQIDTSKL